MLLVPRAETRDKREPTVSGVIVTSVLTVGSRDAQSATLFQRASDARCFFGFASTKVFGAAGSFRGRGSRSRVWRMHGARFL